MSRSPACTTTVDQVPAKALLRGIYEYTDALPPQCKGQASTPAAGAADICRDKFWQRHSDTPALLRASLVDGAYSQRHRDFVQQHFSRKTAPDSRSAAGLRAVKGAAFRASTRINPSSDEQRDWVTLQDWIDAPAKRSFFSSWYSSNEQANSILAPLLEWAALPAFVRPPNTENMLFYMEGHAREEDKSDMCAQLVVGDGKQHLHLCTLAQAVDRIFCRADKFLVSVCFQPVR